MHFRLPIGFELSFNRPEEMKSSHSIFRCGTEPNNILLWDLNSSDRKMYQLTTS